MNSIGANSGPAVAPRPIGGLTQQMGAVHQQLNALEELAGRLLAAQSRLLRPEPANVGEKTNMNQAGQPLANSLESEIDHALTRLRELSTQLDYCAGRFDSAV